jgi:hypothetical protein
MYLMSGTWKEVLCMVDPVGNFVVTDDGGRRYEALPAEHSCFGGLAVGGDRHHRTDTRFEKIDVIELLARLGDAELRRQIDPLQVRGQEREVLRLERGQHAVRNLCLTWRHMPLPHCLTSFGNCTH